VGFVWLIILKNYSTDADLNQAIKSVIQDAQSKGPLFGYAIASSLISLGRRNEAREILFEANCCVADNVPWIIWLKGNFLLQELNPQAERFFLNFIRQNGSASYVKAAYLRISWLWLCLGNETKASEYKAAVLSAGKEDVDEDTEAMREALAGIRHEVCLLRSRLKFDGGDFTGALSEITRCAPSTFRNLRDIEEYHYRLGRIYMKLGDQALAKRMFVRCLSNPGNTHSYFKPNSALMMGLMMEKDLKISESRKFFMMAIEFHDHEFERSIELKAKEGLNRLSGY